MTSNLQTFCIHSESIDTIVRLVCSGLGLAEYQVSWDFVDAGTMQELNRKFRHKDRSTDVLSFPQEEWLSPRSFFKPQWPLKDETEWDEKNPPHILGDVVICPEDASHNAADIGHSLDREACFLLVHGILHLCGHDHEIEEQEQLMLAEQKSIMAFLETAAARPLWDACISVED